MNCSHDLVDKNALERERTTFQHGKILEPTSGQYYSSTAFHSLTVLVAESKFTPTFTSFLPSEVYGTR